MDAYDLYKPLRNDLRQFSLLDSLRVIRAYVQHLQFGENLPHAIDVPRWFLQANHPVDKTVFEWQLEIIAKEIALNCPDTGDKDLKQWNNFSRVINKLKDLENNISGRYQDLFHNYVFREMHRIAHRQFPWQQKPNSKSLLQYFKIFSHPQVNFLVERQLQLTPKKLYMLGLAITGFYLKNFALSDPSKYEMEDITQNDMDLFISHFSTAMPQLQSAISESQSYDQDYAYVFNPLKKHPLIWVELCGQQRLLAPIPTYLFIRFTEGIYYEICQEPEFGAGFGNAFQNYTGEVLEAGNIEGNLTISPEEQYYIGKDRKDSVDWIASDKDAALFIECKTKRMTQAAKMSLTSDEELYRDLDKIADFIVQIYKTLINALGGYYQHWQPNNRNIYPLVVTLEEWYAFGGLIPTIDGKIHNKLVKAGINTNIVDIYPYSICNISELEDAIQVMSISGIDSFMRKKTTGEQKEWQFGPVMRNYFPDSLSQISNNLFPEDAAMIHPTLASIE